MDGFINFLKPPGMTSSDAVVMIRRMCPKGTRVGHGGTLDPDAAGVLPVCVGMAARLFDYIIDKDKEYIAELTLGIETDTQDSTGRVISEGPADVENAQLERVLAGFSGVISQVPPAYSAIKRGGVRAYEAARKGEAFEIEPRNVRLGGLSLIRRVGEGRFLVRVRCGKGLYVRTLMHDIGKALGTCGHMSFLLRSKAGYFDVSCAVTPEELRDALDISSLLVPMDAPISHLPRADVDLSHIHAVTNGNPLKQDWFKLYGKDAVAPHRVYIGDKFCGIGEIQTDGSLRFKAMLLKVE